MTTEAPTTLAAERPNVIERLTSASTSSDLSVDLEKRGDADYLIAAGIQRAGLGRLVPVSYTHLTLPTSDLV